MHARAVRRVRAVEAAAVLRRAARRGRQRFHRRRPSRSCSTPTAAASASRSATKSVYAVASRARSSADGSQLLATITNDAWFGRSSAAYQHFEQGALRAVEEGRYVVRAANTGISGAVDPYGRVHRTDARCSSRSRSRLTSGCSMSVRSTAASATSSPGCRAWRWRRSWPSRPAVAGADARRAEFWRSARHDPRRT